MKKILFTPGPPPIISSGLASLDSAFGRNDDAYVTQRDSVLQWLLGLTGQSKIIELQGSGTLSVEIMLRNFVYGRVLVVNTGFYSDRIFQMCKSMLSDSTAAVTHVSEVMHDALSEVSDQFDWIVAVYVETSIALKQNMVSLKELATRCSSKLAIDAVASIGLEDNHDMADVVAFSSCKGLFGITGASFVSYTINPQNVVDSFYLNISTHLNRLVTGPYAQIQYLFGIKDSHDVHFQSVVINKKKCLEKFETYLFYESELEPNLCTRLSHRVQALTDSVILYQPRSGDARAVINHLGEVHLGKDSRGAILDNLDVLDD